MSNIKDYGVLKITFDADVELENNDLIIGVKCGIDREIGDYMTDEQIEEVTKQAELLGKLLKDPIRSFARDKIKEILLDEQLKELQSMLPKDLQEGLDKLDEMVKKDDDSFVKAFTEFIKSL